MSTPATVQAALSFIRQHDPKRAKSYRASDNTVMVMCRQFGGGVYGTKVVGWRETRVDVCKSAAFIAKAIAKNASKNAENMADVRAKIAVQEKIIVEDGALVSDLTRDMGLAGADAPAWMAGLLERANERLAAAKVALAPLESVLSSFLAWGWDA